MGKKVWLTVTDIGERDLGYVHEWLSDLDKSVEVEARVCDARSLDKCPRGREGYCDMALLWRYSTPHFSPWDLVRIYASAAKLLKEKGVLLLEETDRLYSILILIGYKDFLVEAGYGAGKLVSLRLNYDIYRGVVAHALYFRYFGNYGNLLIVFLEIISRSSITT